MYKIIISLLLITIGLQINAQEFKVQSFEIVPNDLTARIESRVDRNGVCCALLKIQAKDSLADVQGNIVGSPIKKGLETYVYMTNNSKEVKLIFNNHLPLHILFYEFQVENLESSMTYLLKLTNAVDDESSTNYTRNEMDGIESQQEFEWVDLGLPSGLKWATRNIGAPLPEKYGNNFSWGEVNTKSKYTKGNYKSKNIPIMNIVGHNQYDAAKTNCGDKWRLPTKQDFEELLSVCVWTKGSSGGSMNGYYVVGPNGNSIFMPSAGYVDGSSRIVSSIGCYWTGDAIDKDNAYFLLFDIFEKNVSIGKKYYGYSIRPVCK